ncbi:hypothetical protein OTU49_003121, partial [Cherax quadricarinatus]
LEKETQREFYAAILPALIVFTVATTLVSSVVVCAAPWVKRPLSPTVRLSLSLAAANTLFAVTWTLCLVANMYLPMVQKVHIPECIKLSLEVLRLCGILIQILHLLVVALNHYIGIIRPLHYAATFTPTTLKVILCTLWLTPIVGMFVAFSSVTNEGFQATNCSNVTFYTHGLPFRIVWTCIFFGPTLVIIIVYCHIFYLLNNRSLYLVCAEQRTQLRRNIKTVRTTALIVVTFLVGWGPAVVKFILICSECVYTKTDLHTQMYLGAAFNTLFSLKVFIDTFIYAIRLPDIRKSLVMMWLLIRTRLRRRQPGLIDGLATSPSRTSSTRLSLSSPSFHRILHDLRASMSWKRGILRRQQQSSAPQRRASQAAAVRSTRFLARVRTSTGRQTRRLSRSQATAERQTRRLSRSQTAAERQTRRLSRSQTAAERQTRHLSGSQTTARVQIRRLSRMQTTAGGQTKQFARVRTTVDRQNRRYLSRLTPAGRPLLPASCHQQPSTSLSTSPVSL